MSQRWRYSLISEPWCSSWFVLFLATCLLRPPYPLDETRYLAVAWEMWRDGHFLLPHLNGIPYPDKPPLLFWLWQAGWIVFGVNDVWPRFVTAAFMGVSTACLHRIAQRLLPQHAAAQRLAPALFAGTLLVALYTPMLMFDSLLLFFVLASWLASLSPHRAALYAGTLTGLGMLAKGPVILIYTLPLLLFSPHVRVRGARLMMSYLAVSAVIPACWLGLLVLEGHADFVRGLFSVQIVGRIDSPLSHDRAWWWYLPVLPAVLLPWSALPAAWKAARRIGSDPVPRRLSLAMALMVIALSFMSGKQMHYLLPVIAVATLIMAALPGFTFAPSRRCIVALVAGGVLLLLALAMAVTVRDIEGAQWLRWWPAALPLVALSAARRRPVATQIAVLLPVVFALALLLMIVPAMNRTHDLREPARLVAAAQHAGVPVAFVGHYQGQFDFLGRLDEPLTGVMQADASRWAAAHPESIIVARDKYAAGIERRVLGSWPYRSGALFVFAPAAGKAPGNPLD